MAEQNLNTAEKFLIMAHHPEKGRFIISSLFIQYGITGAILLDMTNEGRINMEDKRLLLKTVKVPSDAIKSDIVTLMSQSDRPRKTEYWVRKLAARYTRYKREILKGLEEKRIVRMEEKKFLGIIPYRQSYLIESYTRNNIIHQLKNDILDARGASGDNISLAGLVEACRMYRILSSDRDELKMIRTQVKKIIKESPVSDVVVQTIRQIQVAIISSVTAATIAASAGRH